MAAQPWIGRRYSNASDPDGCLAGDAWFSIKTPFLRQSSGQSSQDDQFLRQSSGQSIQGGLSSMALDTFVDYYQATSMGQELSKETDMVGCRIAFLVIAYFGLGIMIGYYQGWSPIDSFYITVVTFTTVGYGDFNFGADNGNHELVGVVFIILGVFVFGVALSVFFSRVLDNEQATVLARARDRELGNERDTGQTLWQRIRTRIRRRVAPWKESQVGFAQSISDEVQGRLKVSLLIALVRDTIILFASAGALGTIEGWSWQEAIYWAVSTATTVGYGDVVPTTELGQLMASIFILLGVVSLTHTIGFVASYRSMMAEVKARHEVLMQFGNTLTVEEFHTLTHGPEVQYLRLCSDDKNITQAEFCLYLLVQMGRVSVEELFACQDAFAKLDVTHTGKVDKSDLRKHEQLRRQTWDDDDVEALTSKADSNGVEISCGNCGNTFMPDAKFCRKCGKPRKGFASQRGNGFTPQTGCGSCGNILMPDALFCRKCGKPREEAAEK